MASHSSIRTLFATMRSQRSALESGLEPNNLAYQETLQSAIVSLDECRQLAERLSLFSPNETADDIPSGDLQYLLIDYYLAELTLKDNKSDRRAVLQKAQEFYEQYLARLENYTILPKPDRKLLERYLDNRNEFSLTPGPDFSKRRETKISRYKEEAQLKSKLKSLSKDPSVVQNDDALLRALSFAEINLQTHNTFHALDMIAQELKILSLAPPAPPPHSRGLEPDFRERQRNGHHSSSYSDRLDPSISQLLSGSGKAGPILSKNGKPLQPFTLLGSSNDRQRLRNGVFRPGHNLPTMSIDEYLAEEKRRGGIIEGGGEQSGVAPEPDEDNFDRADQETMKAREWDEFKEENPKGSGNTLNRG